MDNCLVTGVAGFIGSHLARRLLAEGHTVRGIDCFTDYYPRALKEANVADLRGNPRFLLVEEDLNRACLPALLHVVVTSDSAHYLATAENLVQGQGFTTGLSRPATSWMPVYPLLLAASIAVMGSMTGAAIQNITTRKNASVYLITIMPDNVAATPNSNPRRAALLLTLNIGQPHFSKCTFSRSGLF